MKRAVVVGATGLVGQEVVHELLRDGEYGHIITLVRRKLAMTHERLEQLVIDFDDLDKIQAQLTDAAIFCLLGTTIRTAGSQEAFRKVDYEYPLKLAQLAYLNGARAFLVVTAMGANAESKIFYSRVKVQLEQELRKIPFARLYILRPSLLLGKRTEFRLGEKFASMLTPLMNLVLVGPLKKYKPIHARTIAKSMVTMSKEKRTGVFIYESNEI